MNKITYLLTLPHLSLHSLINLVLLLIFLCLFPASSFADGWIYQNIYPTSKILTAVKFVNSQKGWIIGEDGTIIHTKDGGDTWGAQESGTEEILANIFFINENTGWTIGARGVILHTKDGGRNWMFQDGGCAECGFHELFFIDSREGWIVGDEYTKEGGKGSFLLHTTDSGKTWKKQIPERELKISGIYFINQKTGWFLSDGKVYRTEDGGRTWDVNSLPLTPGQGIPFKSPPRSPFSLPPTNFFSFPLPHGGWVGDIYFADSKKGWAVVGLSSIFYTDDGGRIWKDQLSSAPMSYKFRKIFFTDIMKGCVAGSSIICTEDSGKRWEERLGIKPGIRKKINHFRISIQGGDFINSNEAWVVGSWDGLIMKTENGGRNWEIKTRGERNSNPYFINEKTGWVDKKDGIFRTNDGGDTWKLQYKAEKLGIKRFFFLDESTGWAVGGQDFQKEDKYSRIYKGWGIILHTVDGGTTWEIQHKEAIRKEISHNAFYRVFFINQNIGWVVGGHGTILHTKDGGKHWEHQEGGKEFNLTSVQFINTKIGWIAGDNAATIGDDEKGEGVILYTSDGGKHWGIQWKKENTWLHRLFFVDKNTGWVTGLTVTSKEGERNVMLQTRDGGETWEENYFKKDDSFKNIFFVDKNRGWAEIWGREKELFLTEDSGKTWKKLTTVLHKYPWRPFESLPVVK